MRPAQGHSPLGPGAAFRPVRHPPARARRKRPVRQDGADQELSRPGPPPARQRAGDLPRRRPWRHLPVPRTVRPQSSPIPRTVKPPQEAPTAVSANSWREPGPAPRGPAITVSSTGSWLRRPTPLRDLTGQPPARRSGRTGGSRTGSRFRRRRRAGAGWWCGGNRAPRRRPARELCRTS